MNTSIVIPVNPVLSWEIDDLPSTLFDIVGEVHTRTPGISFGLLRSEIGYDGASLRYPRRLELCYRMGYMYRESLPIPMCWDGFDEQKRATLKWKFHDLPVRLSFLLATTRSRFPGVSFQTIGITVEMEDRYLVLTNVLREVPSQRLVI
jgi:hypothetical protein